MNPPARPAFDSAQLRKTVLDMAYAGSTVHIGCAFSIIELLAVLYRSHLRYPGNDPRAEGRDYLVLSKGHGVMAQYACMRELGWLDDGARRRATSPTAAASRACRTRASRASR